MSWYNVVSVLCAGGGLLVSWVSLFLAVRRRDSEEARELGTILTELSFLKSEAGEIKDDTRELRQCLSEVNSRLVRIEENHSQTQMRLDRFDSRISHGHDNAVS